MALQQFSLVSPDIQPGQLFQSLATALPAKVIEQALDQTGTREQRSRLLPTYFSRVSDRCPKSVGNRSGG